MPRIERTGQRTVVAMAVVALIAIAKCGGLWVFAGILTLTLAAMIPYRLRTGVWPGDEHLAHETKTERHRRNRPAYVFIALMIVLGTAFAIYAQSHAR